MVWPLVYRSECNTGVYICLVLSEREDFVIMVYLLHKCAFLTRVSMRSVIVNFLHLSKI